jgi:transcriptional regulator with XRE-family HTH domain
MSRQAQLSQIVGKLVAKKREAAGLTQEDVGERINLSVEGYARIERGITPLSVSRLVKLADIFGCSITELVIETSTGLTAQAQHIAGLLEGISSSDRDEIVKIVESICDLSHKKHLKGLNKTRSLPGAPPSFQKTK